MPEKITERGNMNLPGVKTSLSGFALVVLGMIVAYAFDQRDLAIAIMVAGVVLFGVGIFRTEAAVRRRQEEEGSMY